MSSDVKKTGCPVFTELSKHIESQSKAGILTCLTSLKTDQKCYKLFLKDGGSRLLIKLFHYQNVNILNMLLSILANACLIPHVRQEVLGTKLASYVVSTLKNGKLGNTLHCRACRLVGNLSVCTSQVKALCDAGVVRVLTSILKSKCKMQTHLMAIRAIRNIWTTLESSREEILEAGTIRHIAEIFVIDKESSNGDSKHTELTKTCLKAMHAFLTTLDPHCGDQMRGENNAQGYRCVVEYCEVKNELAIRCLHSLSQIAECRPVLGTTGAIECLITLITEEVLLSWEVLASICLFCREAVNRAKIRSGAGLEAMLALLKKDEYKVYHPMLLHGLAQFIYDDLAIVTMVKNGLLDVLVEKLKQMVLDAPKIEEEKIISKKRSGDESPYKRADLKFNRTSLGRFSSDYLRDDWSPGSATSMCSSPPSTPPLPFYANEIDEIPEDNYSPVCSDNEWGDNEEEVQEELESVKSSSSITVEIEETRDMEKRSKTTGNEYVNVWTLALLSRLSHSNEPIDRLADPMTIGPLTNYIRAAKNPRASRILTRIVRNRAYLLPLLKQGFVFEAQTLYGSEQYTRQLCALAETGGALGELACILLRGTETHKFVIAVSIPFLIKSKVNLRTLLNKHGGLPLIFRVLADQEHVLYENAIWSICRLASSLEIRPDTIEKNQFKEGTSVPLGRTKNCDGLPKPPTVTFELDDGTAVDACRDVLCQKSDFFSAMLEGSFSESGKRRVKLRQASNDGLNTLLLAASGSTVFDDRTIESLLDAVLLADKFLMYDVSEVLTESSISKLSFENFSRAWNWARNNECRELKICCVKIFLTAKLTEAERLRAFRDFSKGDNFQEFLDDVKEIINGALCQR